VSRRVAALAMILVAGAARALAPPVVAWQEAAAHVGEIVTLDGVVAAVRTTPDAWYLEFAPDDPHAAHVVLVLGLLSSVPRAPERLYANRRVRASGLLRRFQGRPEMVLKSVSQIEVVDVAGPDAGRVGSAEPAGPPAAVTTAVPPATVLPPAAPPPAHPPAPSPAAAAVAPPGPPPPTPATVPAPPAVSARPPATVPAAVAPAPPPAAPTPVAPAPAAPAPAAPAPAAPVAAAGDTTSAEEAPPRGLSEDVARRLAALGSCARARTRWRDAADRVSDLSGRLTRCLGGAGYRCHAESAALAPALTDLEWAEQQVDESCP